MLGVMVAAQPKLAALGVAGLAVALAGAMRPSLLVVLMFLGMLFDRLGLTGMKIGAFPVTASKLSVLGSIGLWIVHCVFTGVKPVRWHPVLSAMLGVVAVTGLTIALSNSMAQGKFTLYGLLMMTVLVALVYASLAEARLLPLYKIVALAFTFALLASVRGGGSGRATGTMGDPNEWAAAVLLLTPFLLGGLADDDALTGRALRLALLLLAPLCVLRSESRTALVVGLACSPAWIFMLRRNRSELAAVGATAALAAPFLLDLDAALYRFHQLVRNLQGAAVVHDDSLEERSELFRQGKQLFYDHWLIGAGPGNFSTATGFISHTGSFRPAHNTYLEIASEQGVVGLIPVGIFIVTLALSIRGAYRFATRPSDRSRVLGLGIGLTAFGLMAATLNMLTFAMAYLVLGFGLAVVHQTTRGRAHGV